MTAQKKKTVPAKSKVQENMLTAGIKLFKSMLPATAKVMFIDSIVVDKNDFLKHVPLGKEAGTISISNPQADFLNQMGAYENELGLQKISAKGDSTHSELFAQTKLGNEWSKGTQLTDFNHQQYWRQNYPFLSSDGITLFFSAEGSESIGGRDIFMSTFDSDKASWYKPQNVGLPFNSTANDYLLAIDDLDSLGWLVTDRRQPKDKVCIYTFVPTETRQNFNGDDLDDEKLMPYARLLDLKATWRFGNRDAAMKRLTSLLKRNRKSSSNASSMAFIVDDHTIITSITQFKKEKSRQLYQQLTELRQMRTTEASKLDSMRKDYHNGNKNLAIDILKSEKLLEQYQKEIRETERLIRKTEQQ